MCIGPTAARQRLKPPPGWSLAKDRPTYGAPTSEEPTALTPGPVHSNRADRPQLKAMLDYVREGDEVLVHSMDRLARNLVDLERLVQAMTKKGVMVKFVKEGLTFTGDDSHLSILMLQLMGAVAQFERAILLERQREGIAKAKARGGYKGRKPSLTPEQVVQLRQRALAGERKAALAREFKVSRETLYAYLRGQETQAPE